MLHNFITNLHLKLYYALISDRYWDTLLKYALLPVWYPHRPIHVPCLPFAADVSHSSPTPKHIWTAKSSVCVNDYKSSPHLESHHAVPQVLNNQGQTLLVLYKFSTFYNNPIFVPTAPLGSIHDVQRWAHDVAFDLQYPILRWLIDRFCLIHKSQECKIDCLQWRQSVDQSWHRCGEWWNR